MRNKNAACGDVCIATRICTLHGYSRIPLLFLLHREDSHLLSVSCGIPMERYLSVSLSATPYTHFHTQHTKNYKSTLWFIASTSFGKCAAIVWSWMIPLKKSSKCSCGISTSTDLILFSNSILIAYQILLTATARSLYCSIVRVRAMLDRVKK